MLEQFQALFSTGPFVPHGHCYLWQRGLVGLHALSDGFIGLAYFAIAAALIYFVQRRKDVPFRQLFWLFAAFIAACGVTHTGRVDAVVSDLLVVGVVEGVNGTAVYLHGL